MRDTKQNLINRWTTSEGQTLVKIIVDSLSNQRSLDSVNRIEKIDDRYDLRGVSFPKEYADYDYRGRRLHQIVGSLRFKNIRVENADFSYADIRQTEWKNCLFSSVHFHSTLMEQIRVTNCNFDNVKFTNARVSYSHFEYKVREKVQFFQKRKV